MQGKTDKQFLFATELNWMNKSTGILSAIATDDKIRVSTASTQGGDVAAWSPEQLFLASISSSFMTTYLSFTEKLHFSISHFECSTIGQVEVIAEKYKFTNINLYPKVFIGDETLRGKASIALEKTQQHCIVAASVNALLYYHSEVLVADFSKLHE